MISGCGQTEDVSISQASPIPGCIETFRGRLDRGRTLVGQTSLSLSEVALYYSFANQSHLSRENRKRFATTLAASRARPLACISIRPEVASKKGV